VEQDGPILLGANKLLHTGSNPVLTANQLKQMKQDFLEKMEQLFMKTAAIAGYIIVALVFLMFIGVLFQGLLLLIG
jgi:hypothetical protein